MSAICGLGMIRFELKDSSAPIWIPEDSVELKNQDWVEEHFPLKYRYNMFIITADNILTPQVLQQVSHPTTNTCNSGKLHFSKFFIDVYAMPRLLDTSDCL
jgi:hypothetical protein